MNQITTSNDIESDIKRLATAHQVPQVHQVRPADSGEIETRFGGQKEHDLLHRSIDTICNDWIGELQHVRSNNEQVEQLVLAGCAQVKASITKLFLLLQAANTEAKRGDAVNKKLADELQAMTENGHE